VTSAEEFPEETPVPPAVLDTPALPVGSILAVDMNGISDLRLPITVRDENVDDVLELQARLSVVGEPPYEFICPGDAIKANGTPTREEYDLIVLPQKLKKGACTKVEVVVSNHFAGTCTTNFAAAVDPNDIAHANYWIWELSGRPSMNPGAAQDLLTSCQTANSLQGTPTSMMP
jgi:hypothetical protein